MKKRVSNSIVRIAVFLMVAVMGFYVANKAIFTHVHILDDGTIVQHAHPYNKAGDQEPIKHHQHSKAQLLFCQGSELLYFIFFVALALLFFKTENHYTEYSPLQRALVYIPVSNGRAPPVS